MSFNYKRNKTIYLGMENMQLRQWSLIITLKLGAQKMSEAEEEVMKSTMSFMGVYQQK